MVNTVYEILRDFCPPKPKYLPEQYPDLTGKTAAITGTSAGIGFQTTKLLLKQNATVITFNRNPTKTSESFDRLVKEVSEETKTNPQDIRARLHSIIIDLSDLTTIKSSESQLKKFSLTKLDYAIFNAGVMAPPNGSKSAQGYELQIGTNVLGHHLLLKFLHPYIINAASPTFEPRVIWLTSSGHLGSPPNGGIDFDSFYNADKCSSMLVYGQSKTGNIYQAGIYGQKYKNKGIISLAVHPGYLASDLQRSLPSPAQKAMGLLLYPPVYGSYTELFATLHPGITVEQNGSYIGPWGNFRSLRGDIKKGLTDGTGRKLWDWADQQVEPFL
ncbi:putative short-chain dehydrogenase/reductase Eribp [[Candida] railenensis]|uniref:Short-chain dehydrogenase/reductase Eribp n=1 Tax=[Candida] railenensis TaxID=45579 RepID=A0A9P0W1W6_9ASCO|nr:putative short-chain dehydrogenase/reductase Eribp [[Candida] railenensis]